MMKFWLGFLLFFSCGCWMHSQDVVNTQIIKMGGAIIIENYDSDPIADKVKAERKSLFVIRKKQIKQHKNIQKRNTKLGSVDSRKNHSEKSKTQITIYKDSDGDSIFSNASGRNVSAVFYPNSHPDLKKDLNNKVKSFFVLFQEHFIKKDTYYYLFFQDNGKLYQFFNKPPPAIE